MIFPFYLFHFSANVNVILPDFLAWCMNIRLKIYVMRLDFSFATLCVCEKGFFFSSSHHILMHAQCFSFYVPVLLLFFFLIYFFGCVSVSVFVFVFVLFVVVLLTTVSIAFCRFNSLTWLHGVHLTQTNTYRLFFCCLGEHFYFPSTKILVYFFRFELNLWNGSTTFILPSIKYDKAEQQ